MDKNPDIENFEGKKNKEEMIDIAKINEEAENYKKRIEDLPTVDDIRNSLIIHLYREGKNYTDWFYKHNIHTRGTYDLYSERDVLYWMALYESSGSIEEVEEILCEESPNPPSIEIILGWIMAFFEKIGFNFIEWYAKYKK